MLSISFTGAVTVVSFSAAISRKRSENSSSADTLVIKPLTFIMYLRMPTVLRRNGYLSDSGNRRGVQRVADETSRYCLLAKMNIKSSAFILAEVATDPCSKAAVVLNEKQELKREAGGSPALRRQLALKSS